MERKQSTTRRLSRRQILKHGLYGGLSAGLSGSLWLNGCTKQQQGKKQNIVIIVVDTLRQDRVGCYGYRRNTTPNIDRLAQEGILFRNAVSSAPWTSPSIGTLLTSQHPCVLGISDKFEPIDSRFPLISQMLKKYGYATYGIVSHTLVSANLGFGRGFDKYDETSIRGHGGISSPRVTNKAISFLRDFSVQEGFNRPFFLFLHYFDPHYHYVLHKRYNYYPSYSGKIKNGNILELLRMRDSISSDDIKYLLALYDSEIAFTDEGIGMLSDELKNLGFYDNSMIILTSDHGEEFMERGWIGHTITLHEELLRVPLIIKTPGCQHRTIDSQVGLIDIVPTIYQYLGLKIPDGLEGEALDLDPGAQIKSRPVFSETFMTMPLDILYEDVEPIAFRSVTLRDWKLIYDERKQTKQVYNLYEDPHERNNLFGQNIEQDRKLQALLMRWIKYTLKKQKPGPDRDSSDLFTPEQRKHLESLGYL